MSTAPWRNRVDYDNNQNARSDPAFRKSYPEFTGMQSIVRGYIVTLDERPQKKFHFLVNPSVISTGYTIANSLDMTNLSDLSAVDLTHLSDGLLTMNFSILLDRTYEVHKGDRRYRGGVLHDILALEQVCGVPEKMRNSFAAKSGAVTGAQNKRSRDTRSDTDRFAPSGQRESNEQTAELVKGVLTKKYMRVLFGSKYALSFDGYVDNLSVEYTHFSYRMVPTRAAVSVSFASFGGSAGTAGGPISAGGDSPQAWRDVGGATSQSSPGVFSR